MKFNGEKLSKTGLEKCQPEILVQEKPDKELTYWLRHLSGYEDLDLPTDYPRPGRLSAKGGHVNARLEKEQTSQLTGLCREKQVTLFTALATSVYLLLGRYSRQEDICLGIPAPTRDHRESEDLTGSFVNTLAIRINPGKQGKITIQQLLREVQKTITAGQKRRDVTFEKVMEVLKPGQDSTASPIFRVLVNDVNTNREKLQSGQSRWGEMPLDLSFHFTHREQGCLETTIEYRRDLYKEETVKRMAGHLINIIKGLREEPEKDINKIELLTRVEKHKLLVEWNETGMEYPGAQCIHELFEKQLKKTPGKTAAIFEDREITYLELNKKSTKLAMYLQKQGINSDSLVGICL